MGEQGRDGEMKVTCTWCGKEFSMKPSRIKERNFCSRECYHKHRARNRIETTCFRCGKPVKKPPSKASERSFCSHQCKMKTLNEELNPYRMTREVRKKIREARLGKGEGKTYEKTYGRHTHRIVAERMLGRELRPGEVVHHIDGNKRNNDPKNLMVFPSQKEHAEWHKKYGEVIYGYTLGKKRGDAE